MMAIVHAFLYFFIVIYRANTQIDIACADGESAYSVKYAFTGRGGYVLMALSPNTLIVKLGRLTVKWNFRPMKRYSSFDTLVGMYCLHQMWQ